ncbi:MAG: SDR family NAD(P)-dependent oxidoreductase [Microcystis sp. M54BS1]|nr:SDR family NAD(P)-dependent oxidoreductase [Microcystis sp. M54BS1]
MIGASSGIGKATAELLDKMGYSVGIASRNVDRLNTIKEKFKQPSYVAQIDITEEYRVIEEKLATLFKEMQSVDHVILTSGGLTELMRNSAVDKEPRWQTDLKDIDLNLSGCLKVMYAVKTLFDEQKKGHLIVTTSIGDSRGNFHILGYGAAKCGISFAVESFDQEFRTQKSNLKYSEVVVGIIISNEKITGAVQRFFVKSFEHCANDLVRIMLTKEKKSFSPRHWSYLTEIVKMLPNSVYDAIANSQKPF